MQPASARYSAAIRPALARRIAFIADSRQTAVDLYGPLFTALTALGHSVSCLTPIADQRSTVAGYGYDLTFGNYDPAPEGWSFLQSRRA